MNILITGAWPEAEKNISTIESLGHKVCFLKDEKSSLPCDYGWVEAIIGNGIFLSHSIMKFTGLKYIQLTSAGFDRVPLEYIQSHGISIHNARGVYSIPMAEYAIAGILEFYKQMPYFFEKQRKHLWEKNRNLCELDGQNVCIVGCGSVGIECAKRLQAFESVIWGVDPFIESNMYFRKIYPPVDIKEVINKSDIVILTLPLSDQTYHMFNSEMFRYFKKGALLVNIARGALVDTGSLITALNDTLGGAVLDVFEEEPLSDSPLWDMDNVIITPHNSYVGRDNNQRLNSLILRNLKENCAL